MDSGGNTPINLTVHCYVPTLWISSADPRNFGTSTVNIADAEMFSVTNDSSAAVTISSFSETGSHCAAAEAVHCSKLPFMAYYFHEV